VTTVAIAAGPARRHGEADAPPFALAALAMTVLAFGLRAWDFGNPVLDLDEQWYLLVGDRMLHGAVPFLDLWDRKPVGLFLLYALMRLLPGDGIVAYQAVATLFAGLTAAILVTLARRAGAAPRGAWAAGALYLLSASVIGGQGGQAPVFYNLPVALAALLTLRLPDLIDRQGGLAMARSGAAACLLVGVAIQIKYTAAFEGLFVGVAHLWALRRAGGGWWRTLGWGAAWAIAGLLPTLVAAAAYARMGASAWHAFWFANFVSITLRHGYPVAKVLGNLAGILAQIAPLILATGLAIRSAWRTRPLGGGYRLVLAWLGAALVGFACIGTFHDHYALPLLGPLAVAGAPALVRTRTLLIVLAAASAVFAGERLAMPDDARTVRDVAALVKARTGAGCPYVVMGDPVIYHLADACVPTAYAFPNTLAQAIEQGSTGIDEAAEVTRIMAGRPPVVVMSDRRRTIWNVDSLRAVRRVLRRDYALVGRFPRGTYHLIVYARRRSVA